MCKLAAGPCTPVSAADAARWASAPQDPSYK